MLPDYLAKINHLKIRHQYAKEYDLPDSFEFELPMPNTINTELVENFGNVVAESCAYTSELLSDSLAKNLRRVSDSKIRSKLQVLLSKYSAKKIVCWQDQWRIKLVCPESKDAYEGILLIPLSMAFPVAGLSDLENIFFGMRECYVNEGGFFPNATEAETRFLPQQISESDKWRDCIVRFVASNGEIIIENPNGEIGWYLIGQGLVANTTFDYTTLIAAFLDHVSRDGWHFNYTRKKTRSPFDSFSLGNKAIQN